MAKKILLADDSITIQKVVELTFSDGDYEVTAVNNGAKAVAKLAEMRPDIILSDIIMPEKNGYEVCEYVKSHPDYRNIPVVLLTGTFEPFDPDRADKAGCDAVVTKPFESQSLIQKVEELIEQSRAGASAAAAPAPAPAPVMPSPAAPPPVMPAIHSPSETIAFTASDAAFGFTAPPQPPAPLPVAEPFAHNADVFGAAPEVADSTSEMPFESNEPAFGGETRAFPRMSFDELQKLAGEPAAPEPPAPAAEPSPWDEAPAAGGETRAFPRMSFDELQKMAAPAAPAAEPSPWDEPAAGGATQAFPAMSFDELQKMAVSHEPEPAAPAAEPSPWDEAPAAGGETRAFERMSFDDLQQMAAAAPAHTPEPEPAPVSEPSPWDEGPAFAGETKAFPRMTFDELQQMAAAAPAPAPAPEPEPEPEAWAPAVDSTAVTETFSVDSFASEVASPFADMHTESPFAAAPEVEEAEPTSVNNQITDFAETEAEPVAEAFPTSVNSQITDAVTDVNSQITDSTAPEAAPVTASGAASAPTGDLTEEQIDRIARRVVQLMSEQVVRNIAWEVIPDLAEIVVKERIRQLESEA